ncbi:hypothetical protein MNEG_7785 [Monoraphidium neglectum]|jgi:hypothetical protein|uniref:Uncharacterized protein n=1 Tax=Monoraphidium neglectum TaxID=145388 RepID=A0A0D2MA89_9CHLO|nr:hypothetical protein MNEG_7785 [Monoraphidium neglectum]KIZ00180.1 hypothetical protein MNEG_7785 [Monoraphidium neglectum]|eukprot:XP_013899199.1 hypothetical protein MNEG_7785 [Monoraphidium neglectum]
MIPAKLRHKRPAHQAEEEEDQPEPGTPHAAQQHPARDTRSVAGDLEDEGAEKQAKSLRITTSKILGTAQPRKPRIGPEFQAAIPPVPQAPPPRTRPQAAQDLCHDSQEKQQAPTSHALTGIAPMDQE